MFSVKGRQEPLLHNALHIHLYFHRSTDKYHWFRIERRPGNRKCLPQKTPHRPALHREHHSSDIPIVGNRYLVPKKPCDCYQERQILVFLLSYPYNFIQTSTLSHSNSQTNIE